jgi:lactoylglutathione lyase
MTINHVAMWVSDLDVMKLFYEQYFGAHAGKKYENPKKQFTSYFLSFDSGVRLEIMKKMGVGFHEDVSASAPADFIGISHLAFSVGTEKAVDELTEKLSRIGVKVLSGPRRTGDGYYESVISDPEGNVIEITV